MKHFLIMLAILIPQFAGAATVGADKNVTLSVPPPDNTYLAGATVETEAAIPADLSVAGGTVRIAAPVAGDLLALGGTVIMASPITGDARVLGGTVESTQPVSGDLFIFGGRVVSTGSARDVFISAVTIEARGTSTGPVQLYGADVTLDGTYSGDVTVIATDRFVLGPHAKITGTLKYNAPQQLTIPTGAEVSGPITYTGSYHYIPTNDEAKTYALFGVGIFFVIRALGAVILAGLFAGIFPRATRGITEDVLTARPRRLGSRVLLGAALLCISPFVAILLLASFAGANLALLLIAVYATVYILAGAVGGVLVGALIRTYVLKRVGRSGAMTWRDAALGALVLYFGSAIPFIGVYLSIFFLVLATGALVHYAYQAARYSDH